MPPSPVIGARLVRFDDSTATDCIRFLDELICRIDALCAVAVAGVGACTLEWRGPSRAWFDQCHEAAIDRLRRARALARKLIDAILANRAAASARQTELNESARRSVRAADLARFERMSIAPTR